MKWKISAKKREERKANEQSRDVLQITTDGKDDEIQTKSSGFSPNTYRLNRLLLLGRSYNCTMIVCFPREQHHMFDIVVESNIRHTC